METAAVQASDINNKNFLQLNGKDFVAQKIGIMYALCTIYSVMQPMFYNVKARTES